MVRVRSFVQRQNSEQRPVKGENRFVFRARSGSIREAFLEKLSRSAADDSMADFARASVRLRFAFFMVNYLCDCDMKGTAGRK